MTEPPSTNENHDDTVQNAKISPRSCGSQVKSDDTMMLDESIVAPEQLDASSETILPNVASSSGSGSGSNSPDKASESDHDVDESSATEAVSTRMSTNRMNTEQMELVRDAITKAVCEIGNTKSNSAKKVVTSGMMGRSEVSAISAEQVHVRCCIAKATGLPEGCNPFVKLNVEYETTNVFCFETAIAQNTPSPRWYEQLDLKMRPRSQYALRFQLFHVEVIHVPTENTSIERERCLGQVVLNYTDICEGINLGITGAALPFPMQILDSHEGNNMAGAKLFLQFNEVNADGDVVELPEPDLESDAVSSTSRSESSSAQTESATRINSSTQDDSFETRSVCTRSPTRSDRSRSDPARSEPAEEERDSESGEQLAEQIPPVCRLEVERVRSGPMVVELSPRGSQVSRVPISFQQFDISTPRTALDKEIEYDGLPPQDFLALFEQNFKFNCLFSFQKLNEKLILSKLGNKICFFAIGLASLRNYHTNVSISPRCHHLTHTTILSRTPTATTRLESNSTRRLPIQVQQLLSKKAPSRSSLADFHAMI